MHGEARFNSQACKELLARLDEEEERSGREREGGGPSAARVLYV